MREPVGSFFLRMVSFGFLYLVPQNNVGIVERFGKFKRIARAGLNVKIPIIDTIKYQTLRIQQLDVDVSTKTILGD